MIRLDARKPLTAGARAVPRHDDDGGADYAALNPLGLWGGAAAAGLLAVAIAAWTESGQSRLAGAYASLTGNTDVETRRSSERARQVEEARQTAETIRNLTRDRDRLLVRMTALERNYEDVTGSIGRLAPAKPPVVSAAVSAAALDASAPAIPPASPASAPATMPPAPADVSTPASAPPVANLPVISPAAIPSAPPPVAAAPATMPPAPRTASQPAAPVAGAPVPAAPAAAAPSEPEPQEPVSAKGEFGVDIGNAPTLAAMRAAWDRIRRNHAKLLDGLQPLIAVRDGRGGQAELRLVVGPIGNPAAAAKLCSSLAAAGLSCQPTQFEGQRLAQR